MTELTNWGEYEIPRLEAGWTWRAFTSESNNGCENHDMSWRCLWEMCCSCADLYIIIPTEELHKILRLFPTVTTRYLNFYPSQELIYVCFWFISAQMMHIACKLFCRGKIWISSELTSTSPFCILSHHSLFDCIFKKVIAGMSCQGVYDPKFM